MLEQILKTLNIPALNQMQEQTIKSWDQARNLLILSPTGTGKTLAFLLPIAARLTDADSVQALIVVPSRELALQIFQVFKAMKTPYKATVCYGGHEMRLEKDNLVNVPSVLIGTPGRLVDHLHRKNVDLRTVDTLVLDEFDKSLEYGFEPKMRTILGHLPHLKKRILTSATEEVSLPTFLEMDDYKKLHFSAELVPDNLRLKMVRCEGNDKFEAVVKLLSRLANAPTMVFCNHKAAVARISALLRDRKIPHETFHGDLDQEQREKALIKFRNGSSMILLSTDLASRGLDIPEVRHVVHYQMPQTAAAFVHRNGRTARMEAEGTAYLLLSESESLPKYLDKIPEEEQVGEVQPVQKPEWETLYISGGKKDKINKVDIVGWLMQKGLLEKDELGKIEVKDFASYVAIKRDKINALIPLLSHVKIKKKKVKVQVSD